MPGFVYGPKRLFPKSFDYEGIFHISDFYPTIFHMIGARHKLISPKHMDMDGINQFPALNDYSENYPRKSVHIHR